MLVKAQMRDIFSSKDESNPLLLKGWMGEKPLRSECPLNPEFNVLASFTDGEPSYTPQPLGGEDDELPKIHVSYETATSFEDTQNLSQILATTQLVLRLYVRYSPPAKDSQTASRVKAMLDPSINSQLRLDLEEYSLELSRKMRGHWINGISKLISLYLIQTTYHIDGETDPRVGVMTHRYAMRYRV